jgi:hypothetical protein
LRCSDGLQHDSWDVVMLTSLRACRRRQHDEATSWCSANEVEWSFVAILVGAKAVTSESCGGRVQVARLARLRKSGAGEVKEGAT